MAKSSTVVTLQRVQVGGVCVHVHESDLKSTFAHLSLPVVCASPPLPYVRAA